MAAYLCDILCTRCGAVYSNLIDRETLSDSLDTNSGVMESLNYRCDNNKTFVRIRRFYKGGPKIQNLDEVLEADARLNICPGCESPVPAFGDRYHVELGNLESILKQPCPKCHTDNLMLLERKVVE